MPVENTIIESSASEKFAAVPRNLGAEYPPDTTEPNQRRFRNAWIRNSTNVTAPTASCKNPPVMQKPADAVSDANIATFKTVRILRKFAIIVPES